jgi:bifunctional DNA-binding transcriptional regulator/antitoxin component of YhaV-PrlF toxin-antitoxin module
MVTWKRTLSISGPNDQASITLPKRWVESLDLESGDKLEIEEMKRENSIKISPDKNE